MGNEIRESHLQIGDPRSKPDFDSIYTLTMTKKGLIPKTEKIGIDNFQSNFQLAENNERHFISESSAKYFFNQL